MKSSIKLLSLLFILPLLTSCGYNRMVENEATIDEAWANVESSYQRRADLIPNLVNTVKGYADFEKETLQGVVEARAKATSITIDPSNMTTEDFAKFQAAQSQVGGALSKLLAVVENYPDLKANENFLALQAQLEGTENRINNARNKYNGAVKTYNAHIKQFPRVIYAGWFGFKKREMFSADAGAEIAPSVEF